MTRQNIENMTTLSGQSKINRKKTQYFSFIEAFRLTGQINPCIISFLCFYQSRDATKASRGKPVS